MEWKRREPLQPCQRHLEQRATSGAPAGGKAVWAGNAMIVWGSAGGGRYNPGSNSWTPISTSGAPALAAPPLVWTGGEVIAWEAASAGSTHRRPTRWRPMAAHDAHGSILVWSGSAFLVGPTAASSVESYDPATDTWLPLDDGYQFPNGPSGVWTGTHLIVWGGTDQRCGGRPLNAGSRFDPAANMWTATGTNGGPRSGSDAILATPLGLIDWNGYSFTGLYDLTLDAWHTVDAPVSGGAVCTGSSKSFGGMARREADSISSMIRWTSIPADGPSSYSVVLWTGQDVLAWEPHGGATFDPVANAWAPVPGYELNGTGVWAGDRLIVYGPTGGVRLNPATSTWQPVSSAGAPTIPNSVVSRPATRWWSGADKTPAVQPTRAPSTTPRRTPGAQCR